MYSLRFQKIEYLKVFKVFQANLMQLKEILSIYLSPKSKEIVYMIKMTTKEILKETAEIMKNKK